VLKQNGKRANQLFCIWGALLLAASVFAHIGLYLVDLSRFTRDIELFFWMGMVIEVIRTQTVRTSADDRQNPTIATTRDSLPLPPSARRIAVAYIVVLGLA